MSEDQPSPLPPDSGDAAAELDDAGRMAQLRAILFGHDKDTLHRRIDRLEEQLGAEVVALKQDLQQMFETLKGEIDDLDTELHRNRDTRQAISTLLEEVAAKLKD
jgi:hypothetical protein